MRFPPDRPALVAAVLPCLLFCSAAAGLGQQTGALAPAAKSPYSLKSAPPARDQVVIPGPLRSFLRMAGVSQEVLPDEVLPAVARNVYVLGYRFGSPTEYMLLLQRYVSQARELQALATPEGEIRVARCEDAGPLLQVLGYHMRNACGQGDVSLAAYNPERAFLTIDSGFPLTRLEDALQTNAPFTYPYAATSVPVLLKTTEWTNLNASKKLANPGLLDLLLRDPQVARLYWAFSKIDPETRFALVKSVGLWNLLPQADVLDFYGSQICIRSGKVLVPGGTAAEAAWRNLVGESPDSPAEFVTHLLAKDRGWLALYFDTLARVNQEQQAHLTQGSRLDHLYVALREPDSHAYAARASFRMAPALLVLFTRQRWLPDGQPIIPGNPDMWNQIVGKRARHWNTPEQVLEGMVSFSRAETDSGPTQIYLSLNELNSERAPQKLLSTDTMLLLARSYPQFSGWYPFFSEFPELGDDSIAQFLKTAGTLDRLSIQQLRGNALGIFQANLGLWQILARQGEIPRSQFASSWQLTIAPFDKVGSSVQLVDAGRKSLSEVVLAATGKTSYSQDEIIDLLAGPPQKTPQGEKIRNQVADRMRVVVDDQRLTSLDTISELSRGLNEMAHGAPATKELIAVAGELREFEMPRRIFTENEKAEWAPGVFSQHHAELQMKTDLTKVIEQPNPPAKIEAARGELAPFLRDTLVGLNYAYYEPPGSQILHINPLFVRSHDFSGETVSGEEYLWQPSSLFGVGAPAGGGAYLVGSLADLPYVLAASEQDFIAPEYVQALIWQELVPSLISGSIVSRWWNVSPHELHAAALYQQSGEELLTAAVDDPQLREKVIAIFSNRMSPQKLAELEQAFQSRNINDEISSLLPADTFFLAAGYRQRFPQEAATLGPANQALEKLSHQYPADASVERISKDFGIPHPALAQTYSREVLNVKPFPAFSGYSTRLFGESWNSTNLYWARLADQRNYAPATLNVLCPQLTRLMISKIFASDYEDWPAVVRAMRATGDDFLQGKIGSGPAEETAER